MQYSFGIIKPDAMQKKHYGKILDDIACAGYKLIGLKLFHLTEEKAKNFYAKHENKSFFDELIQYMCLSPVLCFVIQKENAINDFRALVGNTDPKLAEKNTLRHKYGQDVSANAIHASDSEASFDREWRFFFTENELYFPNDLQ